MALRSLSNLIDSDSGKTLSYNELKDPKQYIGMTSIANEKTEWNYQSKSEKVYVVCEKMACQSAKPRAIGLLTSSRVVEP